MKRDEISSTEKLLDLIRNDGSAGGEFPGRTPASAPFGDKRPLRFPAMPTAKNTLSIGVDLGRHDLRLVKVHQSANNRLKLLACHTLPYNPQILPDSPQFAAFLREALSKFCGPPSRSLHLWSTVAAASVEVRYLLVPVVAKKQLPQTVFWSFKKELPFNDKEFILDFEEQGEVLDKGVPKTAVLAYIAPIKEIEARKQLFAKCDYPLTGITTASFAFQNLFRTNWTAADASSVLCNLHIGREWSRIDIFAKGRLVLIRGIKTGIYSMAGELINAMKSRETPAAPADLEGDSLFLSLDGQETPPAGEPTMEEALDILASANGGRPLHPVGKHADVGMDAAQIFELIEPAVERLTRQLERTFEHFSASLGGESVRKIYISGLNGTYDHLVTHLKEQLGIPCEIMDPFATTLPHAKEILPPQSAAERAAYTLATGLALSGNRLTPNFLFTHRDKTAQARTLRIDRGIFATFLALSLLCGGYFFYQTVQATTKNSRIVNLREQLSRYHVTLNQDVIHRLAQQVRAKKERTREYGRRYLGLGIIGELTALTPKEIALVNCTIRTAAPPAQKPTPTQPAGAKKQGTESTPERELLLKGIVSGDAALLDSNLTLYLMKLRESPLFGQPQIQSSSIDTFRGAKILSFTLSMEIL